jgi:hypothetical protein
VGPALDAQEVNRHQLCAIGAVFPLKLLQVLADTKLVPVLPAKPPKTAESSRLFPRCGKTKRNEIKN